MKNANLFKKVAITGTLLTVGSAALIYSSPQKVAAKILPAATTKDYNKLQKLSKKPGAHYLKTRKWYAGFTPGENVEAFRNFNSYKLTGSWSDPGVDDWVCYIGAGTLNDHRYFIMQNSGHKKYLYPAEYAHVPYGYKFKKGHTVVHDYLGSLANAWNGYDEYHHDYSGDFTKENIIYSGNNKRNSAMKITLKRVGKSSGKNQGFWIGKKPIKFKVDGTDTYENYYPLYNYNPNGELTVSYIKTDDLSQFKRATVTYTNIGTITRGHSFKPKHKKLDM